MYGSHEYSDLVSKVLNMHIKISWSSHSYRSVDWPKSSCRLLLLWCTAIISYHFNRKTGYKYTTMACYRQARNLLPGMSLSRREKTTTNTRYWLQFNYGNTTFILCMSNGLHCAYIIGIHDKRIVTMWYLPQTIRVFPLLFSILSADCFTILYAKNNLWVMLEHEL